MGLLHGDTIYFQNLKCRNWKTVNQRRFQSRFEDNNWSNCSLFEVVSGLKTAFKRIKTAF